MSSESQNRKFEAEIALIRESISCGELVIADGGLIAILAKDPLYAPALRLRSLVLAAMDRFPEALAAAIVLTAVSPLAENWTLRGKLELQVNFAHSAIYSFNTAKELEGVDLNDLLRKAKALAAAQQRKDSNI